MFGCHGNYGLDLKVRLDLFHYYPSHQNQDGVYGIKILTYLIIVSLVSSPFGIKQKLLKMIFGVKLNQNHLRVIFNKSEKIYLLKILLELSMHIDLIKILYIINYCLPLSLMCKEMMMIWLKQISLGKLKTQIT